MLSWLYHVLGISGSGSYYGFWSGFGSDLGEFTLLTGVIATVRHQNCHTKGCWRLGHPLHGTPYRVCHRHHPDHTHEKRNVPHEHIREAHRG